MKKTMMIGLAAAWAAGAAIAQDDVVMVDQMGGSGESEVRSTVEVALVSAYVWRGQVHNDDMVIQPQVTVSQYGVSLNFWGNYDLGTSGNGTSWDFSEIDFSLAYQLPIDISEFAIDVGVISYHFPANGTGNVGSPSTVELFGKATLLSWKDYVIPSVTLFGDVDEAKGVYFLFDVVAPYQFSDYFAVEGGISVGWGNTSYNDYYWASPILEPTQDEGLNDFNFYVNASYEILENLTASFNATYTMLEGGSIHNAAAELYESTSKLWGGVNIAYDF